MVQTLSYLPCWAPICFSERCMRSCTAMTGEVTLRGLMLHTSECMEFGGLAVCLMNAKILTHNNYYSYVCRFHAEPQTCKGDLGPNHKFLIPANISGYMVDVINGLHMTFYATAPLYYLII